MNIINPKLPEPYKYETNFRNIPREYLNPRIPKGRGIIKWQPFKTIPKQYEMIDQFIENQNKIDLPILSEDQLQEINENVALKLGKNVVSTITYWDNGYIQSKDCFIKKLDRLEGKLIINELNNNYSTHINLQYILSVE
ncbi:YolD-like family protein [Staphylococcus agnetis]|uniref:YolD-like family protein n=1 Tax=Staphylococcus agnetis TaxID=985762 RepID=UPI000D042A15|nr:YolD-like family protein [Staphylococcus agnetis]